MTTYHGRELHPCSSVNDQGELVFDLTGKVIYNYAHSIKTGIKRYFN